jgi:hypothetical protein
MEIGKILASDRTRPVRDICETLKISKATYWGGSNEAAMKCQITIKPICRWKDNIAEMARLCFQVLFIDGQVVDISAFWQWRQLQVGRILASLWFHSSQFGCDRIMTDNDRMSITALVAATL